MAEKDDEPVTQSDPRHSGAVPQSVIDLYDEYTHRPLPRRAFLERLAVLAGGTAAAYGLLALLENDYARAAVVAPNDPGLQASRISYPGAGNEMMRGYLASPAAGGKLPGVIVIHENRGLNPHIEDVVRRVALAGYLALGPDLLTPMGGTPADEDRAREMIAKLPTSAAVANLQATLAFLEHDARCTGKVGCVGFCWGGGMVNQLAVRAPSLAAAVAYYGMPPAANLVPNIHAPLLLHYAGLDRRIDAHVPEYEAALAAAHKTYTIYTYAGANHAFNNDTNPARYDAAAAKLAWQRTLEFLARYLKG